MRLIDADPIIEALEKEKASDDCRGFWYSTVCSMLELIKSRPVVELVERKHGKWLREDGRVWSECSNCGSGSSFETKYCGRCGAEMRADHNGEATETFNFEDNNDS